MAMGCVIYRLDTVLGLLARGVDGDRRLSATRGAHSATLRIDLLNAILGDLKQVLAVEGGSCMRGDIDGTLHLPTRRIEGVQLVPRSKPDVLPVIGDTIDSVGTRKGAILTNDF